PQVTPSSLCYWVHVFYIAIWLERCLLCLLWVTMCGEDNKYEVLEKAGKDLEAMRVQQFSRLVKEFQGNDFWKLWGVIPQEYLRYTTHSSLICNNFVHEYVEAATLSERFIGTLASRATDRWQLRHEVKYGSDASKCDQNIE
ncbi:hypothetical protein HID58_023960, partial [Brassica napus]